ncbi:MAG TPA: VOC family protein [Kofleriaceae bacterium]|nr:VOC family protein [Kofleriaceae bacterium]
MQRFEIAIDGPQRHAEAIRELLRGDAGAACTQGFGEGEQAGFLAHEGIAYNKPDKRLSKRAGNVKLMQTNTIPPNAISWFEIPVTDMKRSAELYTRMIGRDLKLEDFGGVPHAVFTVSRTDVAVTGALVEDASRSRGAGVTIYLAVASVPAALDRAVAAGAKVVQPVTDIGPFGTIALLADLDGNVVGLHTEKAVAS